MVSCVAVIAVSDVIVDSYIRSRIASCFAVAVHSVVRRCARLSCAVALVHCAPLRPAQSAPLGLVHGAPLRFVHGAPLRFACRAPLRFVCRAPLRFVCRAPLRFACRAPLRFACRAPLRFACRAPLRLRRCALRRCALRRCALRRCALRRCALRRCALRRCALCRFALHRCTCAVASCAVALCAADLGSTWAPPRCWLGRHLRCRIKRHLGAVPVAFRVLFRATFARYFKVISIANHVSPGREYRTPSGKGVKQKRLRRARKSVASRYYQLMSGHAAVAIGPYLRDKIRKTKADRC